MKTEMLTLLPFDTVPKKIKFIKYKISVFHFLMKPKFIQDRTILVHQEWLWHLNRKEIFSAFILKGVYDFISSNNNTATCNWANLLI